MSDPYAMLILERKEEMKTFRVWLTFTQHDWVDVKAESLDDAFEIAWDWEAQNFPKGDELARLFPQIVDWN